jgi:hypothetical protein
LETVRGGWSKPAAGQVKAAAAQLPSHLENLSIAGRQFLLVKWLLRPIGMGIEIGKFLGRGRAGCSGSRDITMVFATKDSDQKFSDKQMTR